jgi:hypothetical protein
VQFTEKQLENIQKIRIILQTDPPENKFIKKEKRDQVLTTELMQLYILIVIQDINKISVYNSLLIYFIAIISVDIYTKTFRLLFYYTKFLAVVLYINRLIILEVAVPAEVWPILQNYDDIPDILVYIK